MKLHPCQKIALAEMDKCKNCKGDEFIVCKLFKLQQDCNVFMVQDREGFCPYAYDESEERDESG